MRFKLDITLTEDDYFAFNTFTSLESPHGKKQVRNHRIIFAGTMASILVLFIFIIGWNMFSATYAAFVVLFTIPYVMLYKKFLKRNLKKSINSLKKRGKLPFDPVSTFEFYDDKLVEITPSTRTEQTYDRMERICIVKNQYILLYFSSVEAYILPTPQIEAQLDKEEFLAFLSQKCTTIEHD